MYRAQLIIGLILASALLVPSMFCLIPGVTLTPAEDECCRQMLSDCGDTQGHTQMEHSCCKPSKPSGESSLIEQKPQPLVVSAAVIENLITFRSEVHSSHALYVFSNLLLEHPPSTQSVDILRI